VYNEDVQYNADGVVDTVANLNKYYCCNYDAW